MTEAYQEVLRFKNGRLTKATPPSWFRRAARTDGNLQDLLVKAGARGLDDVGEHGDRIEIFKAPQNGYLFVFRDVTEDACNVFVDNLADFPTFKTQYVAPMAQLIMAADQHFVWQLDQKKRGY